MIIVFIIVFILGVDGPEPIIIVFLIIIIPSNQILTSKNAIMGH